MSIDRAPIAAVRIIGRAGWTSDIRAEIQPVNANASSTITKVTGALDGPGISTMASQGSDGPRRERRADRQRIAERRSQGGRRDPILRLGMRRQRIASSQFYCDLSGQARGKTAGHVQLGELIEFRIGCGLQLDSFLGQLAYLLVALGT